jgi:TonB family protein
MGAVYKAFDPLIKRTLALKTIRLDIPRNSPQYKSFIDRFYHEARISGTLSHPNIVTLFDIGEETGLPYLAMEFVEGHTISSLIESGTRFKPEKVISLVSQVASAVDYAHSKGVIHRDIKPSNLILYDGERVKVTDFGIAKLVDAEMTQSGTLLGTPAYMSPEQAMGEKLDGRSDIFSLGVCAFEMLSGEQPFGGPNVTSILYKLVHVDPVEPANLEMSGLIPQKWREVFGKVLAKKPDDRYQTATEFVQDLEYCLGSWFGGVGETIADDSPMAIRAIAQAAAVAAQEEEETPTQAMPAMVPPPAGEEGFQATVMMEAPAAPAEAEPAAPEAEEGTLLIRAPAGAPAAAPPPPPVAMTPPATLVPGSMKAPPAMAPPPPPMAPAEDSTMLVPAVTAPPAESTMLMPALGKGAPPPPPPSGQDEGGATMVMPGLKQPMPAMPTPPRPMPPPAGASAADPTMYMSAVPAPPHEDAGATIVMPAAPREEAGATIVMPAAPRPGEPPRPPAARPGPPPPAPAVFPAAGAAPLPAPAEVRKGGARKGPPVALLAGIGVLVVLIGVAAVAFLMRDRGEETQAEASPAPTTVAPSVAPPTTQAAIADIKGAVSITSQPAGATVVVDGTPRGVTPLEVSDLAMGAHELKLELKGFAPGQQKFVLSPEAPRSELKVALSRTAPPMATAEITSQPSGALVKIDGVPAGHTPFMDKLKLGSHQVEVSKDGYEPWSGSLDVATGKKAAVHAWLKSKSAPTPAAAVEAADPNRVHALSEVDTPPKKVSGSTASYPEGRAPKLKSGQTVSVTVSFVVGTEGGVHDVTVLDSGGAAVDREVVKAVSRWKYTPAVKGGNTVRTRVSFKQTFQGG